MDKPDNLIGRSTMVKILADCYIIESTVHTSPDSINRVVVTQEYYRELFNRYQITREQFISSMEYYVSEESSAEKLLTDASNLIAQKRKELAISDTTEELPETAPTAVDIP